MKKVLIVANLAKEHIRKFHIPTILMLKEMGYQVDVACNMDVSIPECDNCIDLPCDRNPFAGGLIKSVRILKEHITTNQYDIVHCHTITGGIIGRLAARKSRKSGLKVIYTNHGMHFYKGASFLRWLIGFPVEWVLSHVTDLFVAINSEDYENAKRFFKNVRVEKINGIGVNLKNFHSEANNKSIALKQQLGIPRDAYVLAYVAEINKNKNQTGLIKAFSIIKKEIKNAVLLLIGPDHSNGNIQADISNCEYKDDIILTGWRNDITEILTVVDVVTASSISEGLGLNVIEAMAAGIPVVAYDNRGHREIINNKNGVLVPMNHPVEMANAVVELHDNPELMHCYIEQAKSDVKKYDVENVLLEIRHIYETIIC